MFFSDFSRNLEFLDIISLKVPTIKFHENISNWGPRRYVRTADLKKPKCFLATQSEKHAVHMYVELEV